MLKTEKNIKRAAENLIVKFKDEMLQLTGITPVVILSSKDDALNPLLLDELENILNTSFAHVYAKGYMYPDGIRTPRRKRELVLYRHIFYYMADKMGYGPSYTGGYLGFDHATAIHGVKTFANLLESKNTHAVELYNIILHEYQKRFESKRIVQHFNSSKPNSKRVLSPMLYAGIDKSKPHKPASGAQKIDGG
jgi:hypothetical protein